jgi:hypothetical protein
MKMQASELKGKTFKEKLQIWAKEVVPYCDEIARTKVKRAFYVFQSAPKENPKVLLLGLNPGKDYPYEAQYKNEKWNIPDGMTVEAFIKANPYDQEQDTWTILRGLKKTINVHPLLQSEFEDMVYMNLLYFNSINFDEFQRSFSEDWKEVFDKCAEFTKFLVVEIIKPDRIVCLGAHCFPQFIGKDVKYQNGVKTASFNGIPVYGIPHPSARLSNETRENIGKELVNQWLNLKKTKI